MRSNTTIKDKVFELRQYQQWLCGEVCQTTASNDTFYGILINEVRDDLRPKYGGCDDDVDDDAQALRNEASKCKNLNVSMRKTGGSGYTSINMRDEIITNHYLDPRKYDLKLNYNSSDYQEFGNDYSYPAQPIGDGTIRDIDTELNEEGGFTTQTGGVRINGILRKVGNVPTGTIFYSASPFCHSPVKDLVKNLSHDSKVKISPEGRNHLETDVRSWFWSRTKYEDRVKFYDTMKTIIDDDETVRNSLPNNMQKPK